MKFLLASDKGYPGMKNIIPIRRYNQCNRIVPIYIF